jgi:hypothetical protein
MLGSDFTILLTLLSAIFAPINFISYLLRGKAITSGKLWAAIQILTIVVIPALFLSFMDLPIKNECCKDSAVFSPEHRIGIYLLIILCMAAYVVSIFRKDILPPIAELFLNLFLLLGLVLNIIFCKHFTTFNEGYLWWVFGNLPIIFLLLIMLTENQKRLNLHIDANNYTSNSTIGKLCVSVLKLNPLIKYPILVVLLVPILICISLLLMLFGQKPDSIIKAFTETYKHGFSQLDYMCDNIECGGHFLCSVGANGHKSIVRPIRYGERNGNKIICNRQLLISNAFEDLIQEKYPFVHKVIRQNYNKVGNLIHKHYHIFHNKIVSDFVYLLMKPLELFFLVTLYTFDKKPENRIAMQYLKTGDKLTINSTILL